MLASRRRIGLVCGPNQECTSQYGAWDFRTTAYVDPISTLLQVDRNLVHQRLSRRNTTLRRPDRTIEITRVVEVYTMGVKRGHLIRETVGRVHTDGVVLVDLDHRRTSRAPNVSGKKRMRKGRNLRPCSVHTDDSSFEQLVRVGGSIGDVPVVVDDGGLSESCAADEGSDGGEGGGSHLRKLELRSKRRIRGWKTRTQKSSGTGLSDKITPGDTYTRSQLTARKNRARASCAAMKGSQRSSPI